MSDWERFAGEVYQERRYRNWILSEEMGDVRFLPGVGVVMVHRVRAEHIVRELRANPTPVAASAPCDRPITTRRVSQPSLALVPRAMAPMSPGAVAPISRRRIVTGSLGLGVATAVLVAALATWLDDAALLLALSLFVWGGRLILEDGRVPA